MCDLRKMVAKADELLSAIGEELEALQDDDLLAAEDAELSDAVDDMQLAISQWQERRGYLSSDDEEAAHG